MFYVFHRLFNIWNKLIESYAPMQKKKKKNRVITHDWFHITASYHPINSINFRANWGVYASYNNHLRWIYHCLTLYSQSLKISILIIFGLQNQDGIYPDDTMKTHNMYSEKIQDFLHVCIVKFRCVKLIFQDFLHI